MLDESTELDAQAAWLLESETEMTSWDWLPWIQSGILPPVYTRNFWRMSRHLSWVAAGRTAVRFKRLTSPLPMSDVVFTLYSSTDTRLIAGSDEEDTVYKPQTRPPLQQAPSWLVALESIISESEWISKLENDWDGKDSPAITKATLARAQYVLRQLAERAATLRVPVPEPSIAPNGRGSVDLFWQFDHDRSVLINVPASGEESPSFSIISAGTLDSFGNLDEPSKLDTILKHLKE